MIDLFDLIIDKPYGVGCGNWQVQVNKNESKYLMAHPYPHNLFLELITEYGVLAGLLFYYLFVAKFFIYLIKRCLHI